MADPIPLDQARRRKKQGDDLPPPRDDVEQCPVIALGHMDGKFYFLDIAGQITVFTTECIYCCLIFLDLGNL